MAHPSQGRLEVRRERGTPFTAYLGAQLAGVGELELPRELRAVARRAAKMVLEVGREDDFEFRVGQVLELPAFWRAESSPPPAGTQNRLAEVATLVEDAEVEWNELGRENAQVLKDGFRYMVARAGALLQLRLRAEALEKATGTPVPRGPSDVSPLDQIRDDPSIDPELRWAVVQGAMADVCLLVLVDLMTNRTKVRKAWLRRSLAQLFREGNHQHLRALAHFPAVVVPESVLPPSERLVGPSWEERAAEYQDALKVIGDEMLRRGHGITIQRGVVLDD